MYPKKDSFSVVILGAWNPSIFHQKWILQNLVEKGTENLTIAYPLDDPTAPRKINFEGINIFPGRKQILLQPDTPSIGGVIKCGHVLAKILDFLSHTPIGACGINFTFEEADQLDVIFNLLHIPDAESIDAGQYGARSVSVNRVFSLSDGNLLNLSLSDYDGKGQIGFNFHYESNDINSYRDMFQNNHIEERFNEAVKFCGDVYGLGLEEMAHDETN